MVFQSYALYPHLDVRSNLGFPLKVEGVPAPQLRQRVEQTAELLGITATLVRRPAAFLFGARVR